MIEGLSRRTLLGRLSASALLATGGCGRQSATSPGRVRVATAAGSLNLTLSELLRQQQIFESFGLDPEVIAMADGAKILGAVLGGSIEVAPNSGFNQVFPAVERGADLRLINAATLVPALALFSAKPEVRSLSDLQGRVVGIGALGSLVHQLTVTLLRKHSVDVKAVRFLTIGSNTDIFKGVRAGTVDGGVGPASFVDDAGQYGVHLIQNGNMSVELPEFTYQGGWTSGRMIDEKRDLLVRVLASYARLFRFVELPSSRDAFLKARSAIFPAAAEREHLGEWNYLQAYKPFATDLLLSPERVRYMQQVNLDFQIQKQMLPFERVADMSLARDAIKLLDNQADRKTGAS